MDILYRCTNSFNDIARKQIRLRINIVCIISKAEKISRGPVPIFVLQTFDDIGMLFS